MQNTIVKEFEDNPQVFVAPFQKGDPTGETRDWLEIFWRSYYLRGGLLWDFNGAVAQFFEQPNTQLPFGRGFIIDQDGRVAQPYFGHDPQMAIARIYELLGATGADETGSTPARRAATLAAHPNPFNPRVMLEYSLPGAGPVEVSIYAIDGRLIRTLRASSVDGAGGTLTWNGRDEQGLESSSGVYFARATSGTRSAVARLVLLR